jgi:hypothetical protein
MTITKKVLALLAAGSLSINAGTTCVTPDGSSNASGQALSASASFTISTDTVTVQLANLQADPRSAAQLLNAVSFNLSNGATAGTLSSSSGLLRRVKRGGSFTDLGISTTGWALGNDSTGALQLCVLCTDLGAVGPHQLMIGDPGTSGNYSNANASIAGNGPHNPFLAGTATFVLNVPGVDDTTSVTSATFFFSTAEGASSVSAVCTTGGGRH